MPVDDVLSLGGYNLRSESRLSARDDLQARHWLGAWDPLWEVYLRMRNRRITSRKEFYESAFVVERLGDVLSEFPIVYDLGAGHGMVGLFAAISHPSSIAQVIHIDTRRSPCFDRVREAVALDRPWIKRRSVFKQASVDGLSSVPPEALLVGVHCCGDLTDRVAEAAMEAGAAFVVVPCCESRRQLPEGPERDGPRGDEVAVRVNARRVRRWRGWGYEVEEREVPAAVTDRGRLFVCHPVGLG